MHLKFISLSSILLISLFLVVVSVSGQSTPTIEQLEIALWPEYDRPAVLVIYRILLLEGTELPARVSLPIPEDVGEPSAVAWQDAQGDLIVATYERTVSGKWATITLETESRVGWLEYYQNIDLDGNHRSFSFTWPSGYSAEKLTYEVQEPFDALEFSVNPPSDTSTPGLDGLNYLRADLGPLLPTSEISIEINYEKESDRLSVDNIVTPVPLPTSPSVMPTGGTPDVSELLPWIIGGAGGILILVAAVLFIRYRSEQTTFKRDRKPRKREREAGRPRPPEMEASPVFCHNCGAKASASDFYCRRCGTQLRR